LDGTLDGVGIILIAFILEAFTIQFATHGLQADGDGTLDGDGDLSGVKEIGAAAGMLTMPIGQGTIKVFITAAMTTVLAETDYTLE
jgi:hypothetical protein